MSARTLSTWSAPCQRKRRTGSARRVRSSGALRQPVSHCFPNPAVSLFLRTKFSDWPGALEALDEQFKASLSPTNLSDIQLTLTLLGTRAGTLLLTGHASAFPELTVEQREKVLIGWATSRILLLRKAYRGFVCECCHPVELILIADFCHQACRSLSPVRPRCQAAMRHLLTRRPSQTRRSTTSRWRQATPRRATPIEPSLSRV